MKKNTKASSKVKAGFDRVAYMKRYNAARWQRIKKERATAKSKVKAKKSATKSKQAAA